MSRISARVLICIPSTGTWSDQFGMSLVALTAYMANVKDVVIGFRNLKSSMLWKTREDFAEIALENGFTHLLFIDTDQTFPPELLVKLLRSRKPVVACNIATKSFPPSETAVLKGYLTPLYNTGLEKVWRVGTGIIMIDTAVFNQLPKPWFAPRYEPPTATAKGKWVGEDWSFCEKLEDAGIPIFVDHNASASVTHIGSKAFVLPRYKESLDPDDSQTELLSDVSASGDSAPSGCATDIAPSGSLRQA